MEKNSPRWISNETSFTAFTSPKVLETLDELDDRTGCRRGRGDHEEGVLPEGSICSLRISGGTYCPLVRLSRAGDGLGEGLLHGFEPFVEHRILGGERGEHPDHVAVGAGGQQDQTPLERRGEQPCRSAPCRGCAIRDRPPAPSRPSRRARGRHRCRGSDSAQLRNRAAIRSPALRARSGIRSRSIASSTASAAAQASGLPP